MNKTSFNRTTKAGTKVRMARTGSMGLTGTRANVDHHADACRPMVEVLAAAAEFMPYDTWVQGHNVHTFTTKDGRQYRLRPIHDDTEGYIGVELFEVLDGGRKSSPFQMFNLQDAHLGAQLLLAYSRPLRKQSIERTEKRAHGVNA